MKSLGLRVWSWLVRFCRVVAVALYFLLLAAVVRFALHPAPPLFFGLGIALLFILPSTPRRWILALLGLPLVLAAIVAGAPGPASSIEFWPLALAAWTGLCALHLLAGVGLPRPWVRATGALLLLALWPLSLVLQGWRGPWDARTAQWFQFEELWRWRAYDVPLYSAVWPERHGWFADWREPQRLRFSPPWVESDPRFAELGGVQALAPTADGCLAWVRPRDGSAALVELDSAGTVRARRELPWLAERPRVERLHYVPGEPAGALLWQFADPFFHHGDAAGWVLTDLHGAPLQEGRPADPYRVRGPGRALDGYYVATRSRECLAVDGAGQVVTVNGDGLTVLRFDGGRLSSSERHVLPEALPTTEQPLGPIGYALAVHDPWLAIGVEQGHTSTALGSVALFRREADGYQLVRRIEGPTRGFGTSVALGNRWLAVAEAWTGRVTVHELELAAEAPERADLLSDAWTWPIGPPFDAGGDDRSTPRLFGHGDHLLVLRPGGDSEAGRSQSRFFRVRRRDS